MHGIYCHTCSAKQSFMTCLQTKGSTDLYQTKICFDILSLSPVPHVFSETEHKCLFRTNAFIKKTIKRLTSKRLQGYIISQYYISNYNCFILNSLYTYTSYKSKKICPLRGHILIARFARKFERA